jgi:two-component system nitrogen regulation sensor histidine kinase NtrY
VITKTPLAGQPYLYVARLHEPEMVAQVNRAQAVLRDYQALIARSRSLQLQFNAALLLVSLLIVGAAVWIALRMADRLVRPVAHLVDAAKRVTEGISPARSRASLASGTKCHPR